MSEATDNLVLEHLRHIRAAVDDIRHDVRELKHRVTALEIGMAGMRRDMAMMSESIARIHIELDVHRDRLDRIERRLDIVPA